MVENPSLCDVGTHSVDPFSKSIEYFPVVGPVNSLSRWNELHMDHPTTVEEADEHGFHLGFAHASCFRFWGFWRQPLLALALRFRVILKEPTLIAHNNPIKYCRNIFPLVANNLQRLTFDGVFALPKSSSEPSWHKVFSSANLQLKFIDWFCGSNVNLGELGCGYTAHSYQSVF